MSYTVTVTKKSASNLAFAFCALPKDKRLEMSALYAFCREIDDVVDEENIPIEQRKEKLNFWRNDLTTIYNKGQPSLEVNRELKPVISKYNIPFELFDELLKGVEMDLDVIRYKSFEDLDLYCYRVASVVGLLSIEIFEYKNNQSKDFAIHLGKAFQLTNILRDVKNDAERGRIYIPLDLLQQHGLKEEDILNGVYSQKYYAVANQLANKSAYHYKQARHFLPIEDKKSMIAAELMGEVYWRLLKILRKKNYNVFIEKRIKLCKLEKIFLGLRAIISAKIGTLYKTSYGSEDFN